MLSNSQQNCCTSPAMWITTTNVLWCGKSSLIVTNIAATTTNHEDGTTIFRHRLHVKERAKIESGEQHFKARSTWFLMVITANMFLYASELPIYIESCDHLLWTKCWFQFQPIHRLFLSCTTTTFTETGLSRVSWYYAYSQMHHVWLYSYLRPCRI